MNRLPTRQLGRTGLDVTMLGYGAMEIRGAPRGRDVSDQQAETILHAVLDSGINYIDTSIDYGVSEERIGRYIGDRRSEYYLASKCGCLVGAPPAPARPDQPARLHPRQHPQGRGTEPPRGCAPTISTCCSSTSHRPGRRWSRTARCRPCSSSSARGRRGSSACPARCPTSSITSPWACSTCSRFRTRRWSGSTRRSSRRRLEGRRRHRHPRRRGQGRAHRGQARGRAVGSLAEGGAATICSTA